MLKIGMKKENGQKNIFLIYLNIRIKILNQLKHLFNIGLIQGLVNHNYRVIYFFYLFKKENLQHNIKNQIPYKQKVNNLSKINIYIKGIEQDKIIT